MVRFLITGVRGKTGTPLAQLLLARDGVEVRGGSSDPSSVAIAGVVPTAFSWDRPGEWPAALAGVDAVYVVRPDRADAPELVAELVASTPPRARVVLLSELALEGFDPDSWPLRTERAVREGAGSWTILRPGWFMQVLSDPRFFADAVHGGELPYPSGGGRLAWIDARDIAAVAELALLDDDLAGQTLELTGPQSLTLPETAEVLSASLGRPVRHREQTIEEAVTGMTGFDRDLTVLTYESVRDGRFAEVTDTVERVLGRPARRLEAPPPGSGGRTARLGDVDDV